MLSDDLCPHVDGMNPKGLHDLTIQFNFQIEVEDLDHFWQLLIREAFWELIVLLPFTLILYPRRCLINFGNKMKSIQDFPSRCPKEKKGRDTLVTILGDVGSSLDYNSRCFTRDGYSRRERELFLTDRPNEFVFYKAVIDKMVGTFIELLFMLYLYIMIHSLNLVMVFYYFKLVYCSCDSWGHWCHWIFTDHSLLLSPMQQHSYIFKSLSEVVDQEV